MATKPLDRYGPKLVEKADNVQSRLTGDHHQPAGGYDATPFPRAPPGYTVKFTFHRGNDLPVADFGSFSSDPYIRAQLIVDLPRRHKQDPIMSFRSPTVRKNKNPIWNCEWIVANVPASGFLLKAHVMDEDPADHDDKLGIAFIEVPALSENWEGFKEQTFKIKKRYGSKRVYVFTNVSAFATGHHQESFLMYTVGPNAWFKHFSPLIGRLAGVKDDTQTDVNGKSITRYNFQAIEMQLRGPVPAELYHRYVEFKPFVAGMFQAQSLRGRILNKALHHQHSRIYNFDRSTLDGSFPEPCKEFSQKFLEFTNHGQGGRIFTYVLTLDGQLRFTETGKEFGIDLLSKHTMHSDVSIYIAFSGEFFVRRRVHHHHSSQSNDEAGLVVEQNEHLPHDSTEPSDYELFIDNDSGTYRPNAEKLPLLKQFLLSNFPGLHITTLDCQKDAERMGKMKDEQRAVKAQGNVITYLQQSSASSLSISSSEEEELDERMGQAPQRGDLSKKVHEMRDVKGQMMRWVEHDGHADKSKPKYNPKERPASMGNL
ncbi:hypothetical protein N7468_005555 [Penicillium chermesinum]|uniref:C2 domain-containing protein n=1 Tax=Penicillium chermesinum TaxID=63820 RepID=A0A9W9TPT2_9EURO|nr:uncharacterized protein N7468_005555 [Penicillium chermesinum]KAJ5232599.1 hypothetical protein N7468_005555 [Penicillium chermesinum]